MPLDKENIPILFDSKYKAIHALSNQVGFWVRHLFPSSEVDLGERQKLVEHKIGGISLPLDQLFQIYSHIPAEDSITDFGDLFPLGAELDVVKKMYGLDALVLEGNKLSLQVGDVFLQVAVGRSLDKNLTARRGLGGLLWLKPYDLKRAVQGGLVVYIHNLSSNELENPVVLLPRVDDESGVVLLQPKAGEQGLRSLSRYAEKSREIDRSMPIGVILAKR